MQHFKRDKQELFLFLSLSLSQESTATCSTLLEWHAQSTICVNIELDAAIREYGYYELRIETTAHIEHVTSAVAGINCHYFGNYVYGK